MKKVLGINASPRKNWNTAQAVEKALEGANQAGAQTRLVHLYDLKFTGCLSCFACKRRENPADICILQDELRPLLEEIMTADALILGSPIYFGNLSADAIAFLERLLFAPYTYSQDNLSKFTGHIASALICAMNVNEALMQQMDYPTLMKRYAQYMAGMLRGPSEWLAITDTLQFSDYGKYMSSIFDPEHKARMHAEKFPKDLEKAKELGAWLATRA